MNIFSYQPPTAGWPIYLRDVFGGFFLRGKFEDDLKSYLRLPYARVVTSGTAAFYLILESLKNISAKKRVIIPSYTCPLVPLAIERACLKTQVCDIEDNSFDFDSAALEKICAEGDVLAIVATHLAGLPVGLDKISALAKRYGIYLIEDCAQALGAKYKDRPVGSWGDFSFFSLCRGKGLTIYEGGVVVAKEQAMWNLFENQFEKVMKNSFLQEALKIAEVFGYWVFYRPQLFWFVFGLPQWFWKAVGKESRAYLEEYDLNFPLYRVSGFRKNIAHAAFGRLQEQTRQQREKASIYIEGLSSVGGVKVIKESDFAAASYPYLVVIFDDIIRRNKAMDVLLSRGVGASLIYTNAITDYNFLSKFVPQTNPLNARRMAQATLILSTGIFMDKSRIKLILELLKQI